jgi:hypothetical protein
MRSPGWVAKANILMALTSLTICSAETPGFRVSLPVALLELLPMLSMYGLVNSISSTSEGMLATKRAAWLLKGSESSSTLNAPGLSLSTAGGFVPSLSCGGATKENTPIEQAMMRRININISLF